jgi:surfactin synthase thioesterase subunit
MAASGDADPSVSAEEMDGWRLHTKRMFSLQVFPGGHFFVESAHCMFMDALKSFISRK